MSREAVSGRKRDMSRACRGGGMGALGMLVLTLLLLLYWCLTGEVEMVTSIVSKARRNNIARVSSNLAQSTSIVRSRLHSRHRDMSAKGLRDESKVEVAEKKAKKGLKMAVEILGRSGEGDHTQSVYLVRWMNTRKKRNGTHYCR